VPRILLCLDDSPAAGTVIWRAESLRAALHASLIPFRAIALPYEQQTVADLLRREPQEVIECWRREALEAVEELVAHLPLSVREPAQVAIGRPWEAICQAGRELAVDLIVVGAHRYRGLDRVLGTTSAKVVDHADRCVYVVR
jgi:universal stress protein F